MSKSINKFCPFCGSTDLVLVSAVGGKGMTHYNVFQIMCGYCKSRGPTEVTEKLAKFAWGRRETIKWKNG